MVGFVHVCIQGLDRLCDACFVYRFLIISLLILRMVCMRVGQGGLRTESEDRSDRG